MHIELIDGPLQGMFVDSTMFKCGIARIRYATREPFRMFDPHPPQASPPLLAEYELTDNESAKARLVDPSRPPSEFSLVFQGALTNASDDEILKLIDGIENSKKS